MKLISLLFVFALLASCSDLKKPDQLARVDGIMKELTAIEEELNSFDLDSNRVHSEKNDRIVAALMDYESDTISVDVAKKMNKFQQLRETIPVAVELRQQLRTSVLEMRVDLSKLKQDISAGNGQREKYDFYLKKEASKLKLLQLKSTNCVNMLKLLEVEWEGALLDMLALIAERNAKKGVQ